MARLLEMYDVMYIPFLNASQCPFAYSFALVLSLLTKAALPDIEHAPPQPHEFVVRILVDSLKLWEYKEVSVSLFKTLSM